MSSTSNQGAGPSTAHREPEERHTTLWRYFWRALTVKYGTFDGRSRRTEYWSYYLFLTLFYLFLLVTQGMTGDLEETIQALRTPFGVEGILSGAGERPYFDAPVLVWVIRLLSVALFVPTLAVSCRRYHDVGLPAWLFWLLRGTALVWAAIVALRYDASDLGSKLFATLTVIAGILMLIDFIIHLWPGHSGPNKYGPDPRIKQLPPPGSK